MANEIQLNNLQTVQAHEISTYLRTIIEAKVSGAALTCFQAFVHWLLTTFSCFYPAYDRLYRHASDQAGRIIHLFFNTEVHDLTAGKIASVITEHRELTNRRDPQPHDFDYLALNGKKVLFNGGMELQEIFLWDPKYRPRMDQIVVEDISDQPGRVKITIHQKDGTQKDSVVDTSKEFLKRPQLDGIRPVRFPEPVYVTESAILEIQEPNLYLRRL